jgi:hypothetical protein
MSKQTRLDPEQIAEYVRWAQRRLGDIGGFNRKERKAAYTQLQSELEEHCKKQNYKLANRKQALDLFDAAIAEIERPFNQQASWVDRISGAIGEYWEKASPTLKGLAALAAILADFLKPMAQLTQFTTIGAAIATFVFALLASRAKEARAQIGGAAAVCGVLFTCSAGFWAVQAIVPNGKENGALAELVPGVSSLQSALLQEARGIRTVLEEEAKRDQADREKNEREAREAENQRQRERQQELDEKKRRISEAGYSLDAGGLAAAVRDGYRYVDYFTDLKIEPNEAAIAATLGSLTKSEQVAYVATYITEKKDDYGFIRTMHEGILADKGRIVAAFSSANAHQDLCTQANYKYVIAATNLQNICRENGLKFATSYVAYFSATYALIGGAFQDPEDLLAVGDFMMKDVSRLPVTRVNKLVFAQLEVCKYYEGELIFFDYGGPINPWASFQNPRTADISFFKVRDPKFATGKPTTCSFGEVLQRRDLQCRTQVILASSCGGSQPVVIKDLGAASVRNERTANAGPITQSGNRNGALTADEVRSQIITKQIDHDGRLQLTYAANKTFAGGDGRFGINGTYDLQNDGRICWKNSRGAAGCFQYYRRNGQLRVRRADGQSRDDIGPVTVK